MPIAQGMKNIAEGIEVSYGERVATLAQLTAETRQMQKNFREEHKEMAQALKSFLNKSESVRLSDFKELFGTIRSRQRAREEEVAVLGEEAAAMIKKFEDELEKMARGLKEFLSDSEAARLDEFKSMLSSIKSRQREREEETAQLLSEYHKDLSEARSHWQNLAKIMAAKWTGKRVPIAEVPKEAEVPYRVEEEAEGAFAEGELKARALGIILDSPQGISLRQLGEKLRLAYIRLARPISELVNEGKVAKRDSLYYSVGPGEE